LTGKDDNWILTNVMHAYLLVGGNIETNTKDIEALAKKLSAKILVYPLIKIEDVRSLNNFLRLTFDQPTLIVSENIQSATEEALNAFLKNLEEPQDNIYFALTAPTTRSVLPTIVSRCEILKNTNNKLQNTNTTQDKISDFLKMSVGNKLLFIDKIKERAEAIELAECTVLFLHSQLHSDIIEYSTAVKRIELAEKTLSRLKGNGNVNLQLTNFVVQI
jgi:hypothetical protein